MSLSLLLAALLVPTSARPPAYPPNAVEGGAVVAALTIVSGSVTQVDVLTGDEPFSGVARTALAAWRFRPEVVRARTIAVVCFRNPTPLTVAGMGEYTFSAATRTGPKGLPFPTRVVEPPYPADAAGEGSAVLNLKLGARGEVLGVEPVTGRGALAEACKGTVSRWSFAPASDPQGRPVAAEALVVCVFRTPV